MGCWEDVWLDSVEGVVWRLGISFAGAAWSSRRSAILNKSLIYPALKPPSVGCVDIVDGQGTIMRGENKRGDLYVGRVDYVRRVDKTNTMFGGVCQAGLFLCSAFVWLCRRYTASNNVGLRRGSLKIILLPPSCTAHSITPQCVILSAVCLGCAAFLATFCHILPFMFCFGVLSRPLSSASYLRDMEYSIRMTDSLPPMGCRKKCLQDFDLFDDAGTQPCPL